MKYVQLLSNGAFNSNLRPSNKDGYDDVDDDAEGGSAGAGAGAGAGAISRQAIDPDGGAVQVNPRYPVVFVVDPALAFKPFKPNSSEPLSNVALNCKLRHYMTTTTTTSGRRRRWTTTSGRRQGPTLKHSSTFQIN